MTSIQIGSLLEGRYEIQRVLGKGGFGTVFAARQRSTGQTVAIKVLNPNSADRGEAEAERVRFRREMDLIAQLKHPNIVRLIDSGTTLSGEMYTVLEYIEGPTLSGLIKGEGALPPKVARDLMFQVLDALSVAHQRGVVHRDLKPGNIMVTTQGYRRNAMVLDFGIAAITEDARDEDYQELTAAGRIQGTAAYMAPEQLRSRAPVPATDIYAWGLIFLEILMGRKAVEGKSMVDVLASQVSPEPVFIPQPLLHSPLANVLYRATHKQLSERYANASEALRDLEQVILPSDLRLPWTGQVATDEEVRSSPISASMNPAYSGPVGQSLMGQSGPVNHHLASGSFDDAFYTGPVAPPAKKKLVFLLALVLGVVLLGGVAVGILLKEPPPATKEEPTTTKEQPDAKTSPQEVTQPLPEQPSLEPGQSLAVAGTRGQEMVFVPTASFQTGLDSQEPIMKLCREALGKWSDQVCKAENFSDFAGPSQVQVPDLYVDPLEVSVDQYQECVDEGGCPAMDVRRCALLSNRGPFAIQDLPEEHFQQVQAALSKPELPITCVNQLEARAYCRWAGKRLPTEAEWERLATNAGTTLFPWGNQSEAGGSLANGSDESLALAMGWKEEPRVAFRPGVENLDGHAFSAPVGSFPAGSSPLNIQDLSGNVHEWTQSLWLNGDGSEDPGHAVARGGGWADLGPWVSALTRRKLPPSDRRSDLGFRCVKDKMD